MASKNTIQEDIYWQYQTDIHIDNGGKGWKVFIKSFTKAQKSKGYLKLTCV